MLVLLQSLKMVVLATSGTDLEDEPPLFSLCVYSPPIRIARPEIVSFSCMLERMGSFESQPRTRTKTQKSCDARHVNGPGTDALSARI